MGLLASKVWRYRLAEDFVYSSAKLVGIVFENKWVTIRDNTMTVRKGYAWDGASPKWRPFDLFTIGTPDGALHLGKPITYRATLTHDVFSQFRESIPTTKEVSVAIFDEILKKNRFRLRKLYVFAVRTFGPDASEFAGFADRR